MNFTGIQFNLVANNSSAYIAFDLEHGFRLLEEIRDINAVYFRDLEDPDVDGLSDTPLTTQGLIIKSSLVDYAGGLAYLEDKVGELIKIGDTWATVLLYNNNRSVTIDNHPIKLPPIQNIQNSLVNIPSHGLANNTAIQFSGNTLPSGIVAGTTYYVRNPTTDSFNISATSGGANITIAGAIIGELYVSRLYSVFTPTLSSDVIKDTIIGKVFRVGDTYTVETFYSVSGESVTSFELVEALPLYGDYEGQVVLYDGLIYTWNGVAWVNSAGKGARTVSLSVTKQAFTYTSNGNLTITDPVQASTVTATAFGTSGELTYDFKVDGAGTGPGASNILEYTPNPSFDAMPDIVTVDLYEDGLLVASDLITMFGVTEGGDAITIILSNEAHTVPTNFSGGSPDFTGSGTTIKVFKGSTALNYVSGGTSSSFDVSFTDEGVEGGSITGSGTTTAIVGPITAISASTGFRDFTITIYSDGLVSTFSKVQSFSRSLAGAPGENGIDGADGADGAAGLNAKAVNLTAAAQVVEYNSANNRVGPASILFTATPQNTSIPTYRFFVNDVAQGAASSTATFTYNTSATYVSAPVKIEVELYDNAILVARDQVSIYAIKPGSNVVTAILSNEAHTIPTDSAGNNGVYTGSGTTIKVYEGATELTYETGTGFPSTNNRFRITTAVSNITVGAISGTGTTTATVAVASNMTQNIATITYTINTRNSVGQNLAVTKIQSFSKSVAGVAGIDGADGADGAAAVSGYLTNESQALFAYANGIITSYTPATGSFVIVSGNSNISTNFTLSTVSNPQNLTVSYTNRVYTVTGGFDAGEDSATLTIRATGSGAYAGVTIDKVFSLSKVKGGYEIVSSLPGAGDPRNFLGSIVFLTTDSKLYRYNGTAWVASVPAVDITGQLAAAQIASLAASQITGQLTDAQLASIAAAKIAGTITGTQIANGAISTAKISAGAVTASQIAADTITATQIAANAITASELAAGSVNASKIVAGSITSTQIATDTITANNIAANAITASELNANAVTADKISTGAVTAAKISVTELSAINANMGVITAGEIRSGTTGQNRLIITPGIIQVFDSANTLRVRLGVWT